MGIGVGVLGVAERGVGVRLGIGVGVLGVAEGGVGVRLSMGVGVGVIAAESVVTGRPCPLTPPRRPPTPGDAIAAGPRRLADEIRGFRSGATPSGLRFPSCENGCARCAGYWPAC